MQTRSLENFCGQILLPLSLTKVDSRPQRQLWYEYVDRYHYLAAIRRWRPD